MPRRQSTATDSDGEAAPIWCGTQDTESELEDESEDEEVEQNADEFLDTAGEDRPFTINRFTQKHFPLWMCDANHDSFNMVVGLVIVTNACIIGLETDLGPEHFVFFEHFFTIFFICEMTLKLIRLSKTESGGWSVCQGLGSYWGDPSCAFDGTLVIMGTLDLYVLSVLFKNKKGGMVAMFRLLRMLRVMRILRLFKVFHQLSVILAAFLKAFNAVMWVMILILILDYVCAIFLTKIFGHHAALWEENADKITTYFGTVPHSMRTLLIVMTLAEWDTIAKELQARPNGTNMEALGVFIFFVFYVLVAGFTFVALITAILCESLMAAKNEDAEMKLEELEEGQKHFAEDLRKHLQTIDANGDGYLKRRKVDNLFKKKSFTNKLQTLEIDVTADEIDNLVNKIHMQSIEEQNDVDMGVNIDRLVDGIGELQGNAKAVTFFDMKANVVEMDEAQLQMQDMVDEMKNMLDHIRKSKGLPQWSQKLA